jgi:hypothetical protein
MIFSITALERAFELAHTGKYRSTTELRAVLKTEGYSTSQIDGPALGRQLRNIMRASRSTLAPTSVDLS